MTVTRMVDELDRVRRIYYSEDFLQAVGFVYDDPEVPYSKGRLTAIERDLDGPRVEYRYDRFGRTIQDGDLVFGYDKNGNRSSIGYPGGDIGYPGGDGELTAYSYSYSPNAAGQNSPQLHTTTEGPPKGPVTRYFFDPAGNLSHENAERHRIPSQHENERGAGGAAD